MISLKEWLNRGSKKKVSKPMRKVSKKRVGANREYSAKRKAYLLKHPYCQAYGRILDSAYKNDHRLFSRMVFLSPPSEEIHHMKKPRAKYLNDESTWLAVCRWSHDWIENNKKTARTLGLLQ